MPPKYIATLCALIGLSFAGVDSVDAESMPAAQVSVDAGSRTTATGDVIDYLLFVPVPATQREPPPYPVVVLTHGFARDYGRHIDNALRYARAGMVVLTPNLAFFDRDQATRNHDVANTVGHVRWLEARGRDSGDALFGLVDGKRVALAGHSAGGAVSLEAMRALQRQGTSVAALVLLDAVPDTNTLRAAARLRPLPLLSLRSEPGPCNAEGAATEIIDRLSFDVIDIKIDGAGHCDPESPTDVSCEVFCGRSTAAAREDYSALTEGFLRDIFGLGPAFVGRLRQLDKRIDVDSARGG